jgi:hypothetical protein
MKSDGYASLGRTEPWLRAIALAIWAFTGASRFDSPSAWQVPWLLYGASPS